jgi:FkbM family methyltransferase
MEIVLKCRRLINQMIGRDLTYIVQIKCAKEKFGTNYGGYYICPKMITDESIVYSLGVGEDISFDLSLIKRFGVNVFAFDPTPKAIKWVKSQKLPEKFHFFECGITDYEGTAEFYPPKNSGGVSYSILEKSINNQHVIIAKVHRLNFFLNQLGHEKIDVLKMDVEGAEYGIIQDLLASNIRIQQLVLEFHHTLKHISIYETDKAVKLLMKNGFKIFYVSANGAVYSFIHESNLVPTKS